MKTFIKQATWRCMNRELVQKVWIPAWMKTKYVTNHDWDIITKTGLRQKMPWDVTWDATTNATTNITREATNKWPV